MIYRQLAFCLLLVAGLVYAETAKSHAFSQSSSHWVIEESGAVEARFLLPAFSLDFLASLRQSLLKTAPPDEAAIIKELPPDALLVRFLENGISLALGDNACPPASSPQSAQAREGHLALNFYFSCPPPQSGEAIKLRIDFFAAMQQGHLHFARIQQGTARHDQIFTSALREAEFVPGRSADTQTLSWQAIWQKLADYVPTGITHILSGNDHLAFLALLLLLAGSWRGDFLAITGFTLGHSLTLALAATGLFVPDGAQIEALIGFTIFLAALEGLTLWRPRLWQGASALLAVSLLCVAALPVYFPVAASNLTPALLAGLALLVFSYGLLIAEPAEARRALPFMAALFGLIHGFGFAGVLLEAGLPPAALLPALAGFNLGVELGQIAAALGFVLLGIVSIRLTAALVPPLQNWLRPASFAGLGALGLFWFVQRGFLL